ncbi:uncharacterized protein GIQ15_03639 [Arthroderma uncinatum]|uniref:uncharacterized protein n=1 Tax=Arthroderma uncinatum TaxID=74035 RepID=UPI00144AA967|nr:uncharacterized protein GIQ15_03639 [Arthroderma uncinatum]KAF3484315.1 hypothetical protein GIQ15_03639 [Arthroderma uncinatum]
MPTQPSSNFFTEVSTQNMPAEDTKVQAWKAFHEPKAELADSGSVMVDIPKTEETVEGGYLGRSAMTGSLGGS